MTLELCGVCRNLNNIFMKPYKQASNAKPFRKANFKIVTCTPHQQTVTVSALCNFFLPSACSDVEVTPCSNQR